MSKNVAASVHQRLLNYAQSQGLRFNEILQRYALERWLYRLSISDHAERFVLKGGLMLTAWEVPITRPTKDIDMLARFQNDLDVVNGFVADVCRIAYHDDGLLFDAESVIGERIAEDALYEGVRSIFQGSLGNARISMQIDLGFSDVITPGPIEMVLPTLLDQPGPKLKVYNRETAIAEKFEAMVKLGELNSRMKDFFDIWTLSRSTSIDQSALKAAVRNTFDRRGTILDVNAVCFSEVFGASADKQKQWHAFVKRNLLAGKVPGLFEDVWREVMMFLRSIVEALRDHS